VKNLVVRISRVPGVTVEMDELVSYLNKYPSILGLVTLLHKCLDGKESIIRIDLSSKIEEARK